MPQTRATLARAAAPRPALRRPAIRRPAILQPAILQPLRRAAAPLLGAAALAISLAAPATAQDAPAGAVLPVLSDEQIKALALEAIRENPEIIEEAVQLLRERDEAARLAAAREVLKDRDALEAGAPVLANADGDVTVIEFLDYNCPYCKRGAAEIEALVAADPNVRLVVREWPILGEGSVVAARAALAAREQDRYEEMHEALMALERADETSVMATAEALGLDVDRLIEDMNDPAINAHFDLTHEIAQGLGFTGTPSFIIGDELVPGVAPLDALQAMVEAARAANEG